MESSFIALGVALVLVLGLVVGLFVLNLVIGTSEFILGKPSLKFFKASSDSSLAFGFRFNAAKEPGKFDQIRVRLFNPFGKPTQVEITKQFTAQKNSFEKEIDLGSAWKKIIGAKELKKAMIQIELTATKEGLSHQYDYNNAQKFLNKLSALQDTITQTVEKEEDKEVSAFESYQTQLPKNMVADHVPGKGVHLKIATNPAFADVFGSAVPGQAAGKSGSFSIKKLSQSF